MRKLILDTETTGLDYQKDRIIELACLEVIDNEYTDSFDGNFDYSDDPSPPDDPLAGDSDSSTSVGSLYYRVTLEGLPSNIYSFFADLNSSKILSSIGLVSFSKSSSYNDPESSPGSAASSSITLSFTLKLATESLESIVTDTPEALSDDLNVVDSNSADPPSIDLPSQYPDSGNFSPLLPIDDLE